MDNRQHSARLKDLENRFSELEPRLKDSPEKEAISILHALIHENRRQAPQVEAVPARGAGGRHVTLEDIADLYKSAPAMEGQAENEGLAPGVKAPEFTLLDANGRRVSLSDFRGQNVVLVFYPLDWSPACSDQLSLYQSELDEFERNNAQILAISVDSIYSHGAWMAVRGLNFPLLSDFNPKGEVARLYKVYRSSDGFSERALFLVDREGMLRYRYVSPELHKIPSIYVLFDQLQALSGQGERSASSR